jgi:hypothetical protein
MKMEQENNIKQIPTIMNKLNELVNELESHFPGRKFTLDGHLVGSIGEVIASYLYDLKLLPASRVSHDAQTLDGRMVQIKVTQGNSVALRDKPDYLIVLKLVKNCTPEEIYNGPGDLVWGNCGKEQKNGMCAIGLSKLRVLQKNVEPSDQIFSVRHWPR